MVIKRSTAYRLRIADIINNQFIKQEGFNPSYIELGKNQISRVNLISTVVGKYTSDDENYSALTLDDGTETIRVKGFGPEVLKLKNVNVGQIIRLVGKIKEYNDEKFINPAHIANCQKNGADLFHRNARSQKIDKNFFPSDLLKLMEHNPAFYFGSNT